MPKKFQYYFLKAVSYGVACSLCFIGLLFWEVTAFSETHTFAEKLQKQWHQYQAAQEFALKRVNDPTLPPEKQFVTREEWENITLLKGEWAFSDDDLNRLRLSQKVRVQLAKEKAEKSSIFNIANLRRHPQEKRTAEVTGFCAAFPKGGMLHIHPWGTLHRPILQKLFVKSNPALNVAEILEEIKNPENGELLYPQEIAWLKRLPPKPNFLTLSPGDQARFVDMNFLPPGAHPFERFDTVFAFLSTALSPTSVGSTENLIEAYRDYADQLKKEKVLYVEFTTGVSAKYLEEYKKIAEFYERDFGIVARFNASFARTLSREDQRKEISEFLETVNSPLVVGIDLLANEKNTPALEKGQAIYIPVLTYVRAGKRQLHRTMHAGELGDSRNPRDAMILGAERLGHGVKLEDDPISLEYAAIHQLPVEINLTSNVKLEAVKNLSTHPFLRYLRLGLKVSLSTDDEGIFKTTINQECEKAILNTDITYAEMKKMSYNAIDTAFVSDTEKKHLFEQLDRQFEIFEKKLNRDELKRVPRPLNP